MWATGSGLLLPPTDHRLQDELSAEAARRQGAARPPGAARLPGAANVRGKDRTFFTPLNSRPNPRAESVLDTSGRKHSRLAPRTGLQPPPVCSPAGGRFVQRLKLGAVPAYHRAGRMMKSRRRRAEGDSRGGELRGRRVVSFYLKRIIIITKCVCLQLLSYDCRLCCSTLLHTR